MRLSTLTTLVAEHAGAGDRDGRLAPPVVDALRESGLFGALVPRDLGGIEAEPQWFLDTVRTLATGDAAAAWIVAVCGTGGMLAAYLEPDAAREVYGDGAMVGGVFAPRGRGHAPVLQWAAPAFEVRSADPVPAGLDGEAVTLEAPVRFTSRPAALRVRIAPHHPGASPSANLPDSPADALRRLLALAAGRED